MSRSERRKGVDGEREVADALRRQGFTVRGLEGGGDHLAVLERLVLHVEVKRHETARPWPWFEQAKAEAPPNALPVVAFRRSRSPWLALVEFEPLLETFEHVLSV